MPAPRPLYPSRIERVASFLSPSTRVDQLLPFPEASLLARSNISLIFRGSLYRWDIGIEFRKDSRSEEEAVELRRRSLGMIPRPVSSPAKDRAEEIAGYALRYVLRSL